MVRRTWIAIPALAVGVVLTLLAGAQDTRGAQASLDEFLQSDDMTQEEMAMQLLRALDGAEAEPPDCVPGEEMFDDVPASSLFCPFIEELARRGITSGCDDHNFCPGAPVTRAQMATFIVRAAADLPTTVDVVTTSHGGGGWIPTTGDDPGFVDYSATRVITQGDGSMYLPLDAPVAIGNTTYRVASIEFCFATEFIDDVTFGFVGTLFLAETTEGEDGSSILWESAINVSGNPMTCLGPLAVDVPITTAAGLLVEVGGLADVELGAVRVTWAQG